MNFLAISAIRREFCISYKRFDSKNIKRLKLKKGERPKFLNSFWKLFVSTPMVHDLISNYTEKSDEKQANNLFIDSGALLFHDAFKSIHFQSIKEIKNDELYQNFAELELFIDYSLDKMEEDEAVDNLNSLLWTFRILHDENSSDAISKFKTFDLGKDIQNAMNNFIVIPMIHFIGSLLFSINDKSKYWIDFRSSSLIKKTRPSEFWKSISDDDDNRYPPTLRDEEMFHSHLADSLITLDSKDRLTFICGIDLEGPKLISEALKNHKTNNFAELSKTFRKIGPFQTFNKLGSYIISDFNRTLYFEYPLNNGKWWSDNEDDVSVIDAPVRYKLIDNSGSIQADFLTLQSLLFLKIYDTIRRELPKDSWLKDSNGNDVLTTGAYRLLDEGWNQDLFNPFVLSQFKHGFKKNVGVEKMGNIPRDETKTSKKSPTNDHRKTRSSKRLKLKSELEGTTNGNDENFDSTKLFPINTNLKVSNYKLLEEYTFYKGVKLKINGTDIFKPNTNISNKVFFKMFDLSNLKYLHRYAIINGMPYTEEDAKEFNQSEINILASLEYGYKDFKYVLKDIKESYLKEITALKKINQWNLTHEEKDQINSPKLLQYGWTYLELFSEGQPKYCYWGPFICTEFLEFMNDNEKDTPKRIENFNKQLKLLSRARIKHNDIKKDNFCFNENDEAYLVDYGRSIIKDNGYLENYDCFKIDPNEKLCHSL
ncbi:hypothetical protein BN7_4374 [Wickerhamomyces ciferrii]|uniref:Protein kinase domain-containing protein n=1 Tax=Wickerhamomyces ciferrii (strain ATCC 14091 / BCRC 22168 / CBS 111 / JCM 3599 / NBRC 0793 / NRRL Y-1031 F-60-10) TaxID=1206466 RepID=K0KHY1_WICCF|nr:uncharacterized protein BN7_4374 [Wickerhamomyces ciferrii]CCH44805.1 hypothetical protein BN7_4374 [Wickerhamomyces ciferrii]